MPVAGNNGGGGKSGDVRAGGAFVEISARDRLSAQLAGLGAKVKAFAAGLAQIGKVTAFAGLGALAPLAGLFKSGLGRAEDIAKGAEELGFTVEQYQRIKYAADAAGVSVEDVLMKQEKYAGLMAQAPVLDAATIKESVEAQQRLRMAFLDLQTAITPLISTLIPVVRAFSEFVKQNADAVRIIAVGAAGTTALGAATFVFGKALGLVVGLLRPAIALIGALLTKTGIVLAGIGGLAAVLLTGWTKLGEGLGKTFASVGTTFGAMFKGIVDALNSGDFDRAFRIFTTGIETVWYTMILEMARAFSSFVEENRDRLIALGRIMGVITGGNALGFLGPWGRVAGMVGGGIAGDQLTKELIDLVKGIATNTGIEQRLEEVQKRFNRERQGGAPPRGLENEPMAARITATRSAFRILGDATQQFGRSNIQSEQLQQLKMLAADGKLQVQELKQLNQYIKDLMRFK